MRSYSHLAVYLLFSLFLVGCGSGSDTTGASDFLNFQFPEGSSASGFSGPTSPVGPGSGVPVDFGAGPGNVPPVAVDDAYLLATGSTISISANEGLQANDTSVNGSVTLVTPPANGDLTLNPDGSFQYVSGTSSGFETFVYQLQDANGTDTATVTLQITARDLFVRANAAGVGTLSDPRGDLDGALQDAESGDIVFILHSPDPLVFPDVTVPGGVTVLGEATGLSLGGDVVVPPGLRPVLTGGTFSFASAAEEVLLSGFRIETPGGVFCIEWSGAQQFRAENLHLSSPTEQVRFLNSTGSGSFIDCSFLGGSPFGNTLNGTTGMGATNLTLENCEMGGSLLRLLTDGIGASLTLVYQDNMTADGAGVVIDVNNGATADLLLTNNTYLGSQPSFMFTENNGGQVDLDFTDCTFQGFGGFTYNQLNPVGDGSRVNIRDLQIDDSGIPFTFTFRTGVNELVMNRVNYINTSSLTNKHLIINNEDLSVAQIRIEENQFQRGADITQSGVSMDLGLINNSVGVGGVAGAGFLRRVLNINSLSNTLCARIFQNQGGSFINIGVAATAFFDIEDLPNVTTDNTAANTITVDPAIQDTAIGTCNYPDL